MKSGQSNKSKESQYLSNIWTQLSNKSHLLARVEVVPGEKNHFKYTYGLVKANISGENVLGVNKFLVNIAALVKEEA